MHSALHFWCAAQEQPQQRRSAPVSLEEIEAKLQAAVDESDELRAAQRHRRQRRAIDIVKSQAAVKHKHEFHRRLAAATVEYRQRKLAIQALVERIEREMQYLRATAADLGERVRSLSLCHCLCQAMRVLMTAGCDRSAC